MPGNMDNADLERLSISPGKLSPKFHPNTTEYSVTLGSDVSQIKVDPLTSDSGASYSISVRITVRAKLNITVVHESSTHVGILQFDFCVYREVVVERRSLSKKEKLLPLK